MDANIGTILYCTSTILFENDDKTAVRYEIKTKGSIRKTKIFKYR